MKRMMSQQHKTHGVPAKDEGRMGALARSKEHSAGGVVVRRVDDRPEVILYRRNQGSQWCLPKGKLEPGESAEQAAVREVYEETGVAARIVAYLDAVHYVYARGGERRDKTVDFYLMDFCSQDGHIQDPLVEAVQWMGFDQAIALATFGSEKAILHKAKIAGETRCP